MFSSKSTWGQLVSAKLRPGTKNKTKSPPLGVICLVRMLNPGLHIVVRIAEDACDDASEEDFKAVRISIEKVSSEISKLRSFQRQGEQAVSAHLKIHVPNHVLAILSTYMETRLKISMKKEHNSVRAVPFQIFLNGPFDNFLLLKESNIPKYLYNS